MESSGYNILRLPEGCSSKEGLEVVQYHLDDIVRYLYLIGHHINIPAAPRTTALTMVDRYRKNKNSKGSDEYIYAIMST